jgi:cytochrome c oxidase cbb3-type subunit 1
MWVAGIMEGLMWRAYDQYGFLQYSFVESVVAVHPYFVIRMLGGVMFLTGALMMAVNLIMTVRSVDTRPRVAMAPAGAVLAGE